MRFENSVLLVTGGASGLGEAVVRRAVAAGAKGVAIIDANADKAFALAGELGEGTIAIPTDVTDSVQVQAAVDQTVAKFGHIDTLVGCAGIPYAQRTIDRDGSVPSFDWWRKTIDVNLVGMFDVVSRTASAMSRNEAGPDGERGVIIMTASVAAFEGQIGQTAYSASKGGIVGMTLPLARDLSAVGIRVLTIAPGLIDTPIYDLAPPGLKEALGQTTVFPQAARQGRGVRAPRRGARGEHVHERRGRAHGRGHPHVAQVAPSRQEHVMTSVVQTLTPAHAIIEVTHTGEITASDLRKSGSEALAIARDQDIWHLLTDCSARHQGPGRDRHAQPHRARRPGRARQGLPAGAHLARRRRDPARVRLLAHGRGEPRAARPRVRRPRLGDRLAGVVGLRRGWPRAAGGR